MDRKDIAIFAPDVKKFANRDASIDLSNCVHSSHFVRINRNKEGREGGKMKEGRGTDSAYPAWAWHTHHSFYSEALHQQ